MPSSEIEGIDPAPDAVTDLNGLVRELDRLRIRAASGTGAAKVSPTMLAQRLNIPRTQRSTLHNYLTGRTLMPVDKLDQIVVALGASSDEQRRWSEAWYRVYDSRRRPVRTHQRFGSMEKAERSGDLKKTCRALLQSATSPDRFLVQIPGLRIPCSVYAPGRPSRISEDAAEEVHEFIDRPHVDLLVVFGEFGSGKSRLLRRVAQLALDRDDEVFPILLDYAQLASRLSSEPVLDAITSRIRSLSPTASAELGEVIERQPDRLMVLIDAFDEVNLTADHGGLNADLRSIAPLLRLGVKVAVAARRSLTANPDDFVGQLQSPSRVKGFGADSYTILDLQPCRLDEVMRALAPLSGQRAGIISRYLTTGQHVQMDRVRRPLFLQMLLELSGGLFGNVEPFSVYQLYEDFVATAVRRDYDERRSSIPPMTKHRILQRIARDMFDAQSLRAEARLSIHDIRVHVVDEVENAAQQDLMQASGPLDPSVLTQDFLRSNHLLVERTGAMIDGRRDLSFIHQSVFEFFLTQHFIAEFSEKGRFGLSDERHSVRAFDSLLPYFLRSRFGAGLHEAAMVRLVEDPEASHLDRLLGVFFLEDHSEIHDLLRRFPSYRRFLVEAEWTFDSYFMQKAVRFQLCLLDRGIARALAYVTDLRTREVDADQDIEVHTFAARLSPAEFLLARLDSDILANVHPIVVYRLGLFGDRSAIEPLRRYREDIADPLFKTLIDEAIQRIDHRQQIEVADTTRLR